MNRRGFLKIASSGGDYTFQVECSEPANQMVNGASQTLPGLSRVISHSLQ